MKESKNPNSIKNKIRKVTTRFLENVVGGKGGGGRADFAQAGGLQKDKIEEAFSKLKLLI